DKQHGSVGITLFAYWMVPFTSSEEDKIATQRAKAFYLAWFFDVLPWGLEGVLKYIKQNYGNLPVYILENGQPTNQHSSINDLGRVEYLHAYIAAVLNSVRSGSDIRGYFQWSFMDMFEFINPNYTYGLYYVNFSDPKRERSPKTSALWYSALLKGKTVSLQKLKNRSMSSSPGVSCQ
ncbi:unnamed protein product, partial [Brassica oleracea]